MIEIDIEPWDNHQWWRNTYTFQKIVKLEGSFHHIDCFNGIGDNGKQLSIKDSDCIIYELFKAPSEPPFDEWIKNHHYFIGLYNTYFNEVFYRYPEPDIERIILPRILYNQITKFIDDNNLSTYKDLLLLIIAKGQYIITSPYYNSPYYEIKKNTVQNIRKETDKLIKLIDKVLPEYNINKGDSKISSRLENIQFKFLNPKHNITISDRNYCRDFIYSIKDRYENGYLKDWKKQIKTYSETSIRQHEAVANYTFHYAKAVYNLLTLGKIKPIGNKPFPNDLMKCVYPILEYSLLKVGDPGTLPEDKLRLARNWIKNHSIKRIEPYQKIKADIKKLKKYFEPEFIDAISDLKDDGSTSIATFITERFDLKHIYKELVHIINCFGAVHHFYHQPPGYMDKSKLPSDVVSFQGLFNDLKMKNKLSKLSLTIGENNYSLTDPLPLHIIENALKEYYNENEYEFTTGLVEMQVKPLTRKRAIHTTLTGKMNKPENRFFVRFICSFYNFLTNESLYSNKKMTQNKIDDNYYTLIGLVLKYTWFFKHQRYDESYVTNKVREWHKLSLSK